ncbi:MAG: hypothetical protein WAW10_05600 [Gallionella sp.]
MPERVFQICGATIPPMIGRKAIMERLCSALTKPMPDHLQVVGPRYAGKSVILYALAQKMRETGTPYSAVVLWDLGHQTPDTDEAFMSGLRDQLASALATASPDYADYLRAVEGNPYKELAEVFDVLKDQGIKVLMLWDGFDKPLASGKLSRNLWDQLRELASRPSLRLVTASRRRLHDLIRSADSQTSDFWNIFDPTPVKVECFDESDIKDATSRLAGIAFDTGAQTELLNWSGGFPPLVLSLLNEIGQSGKVGNVDPVTANQCAEKIVDDLSAMLSALWGDCPEASKDIFREISEAGVFDHSKLSQHDLAHLTEKGFMKKSGAKVTSNCRFLEKHLACQVNDSGSMIRLFGSADSFNSNIRPLLERRMAHLPKLDATLKRYIERGIEDLPNHPDVCLSNVRGIVDRALDLVWAVELEAKKIPSGWFDMWKRAGETGFDAWNEQFPTRRGHQIRLLQLMTGTDKSTARARFVSKSAHVLVNAAHGFGDFGQHLDGAPVDLGTAFAALTVCVELAAVLDRELGNAKVESA